MTKFLQISTSRGKLTAKTCGSLRILLLEFVAVIKIFEDKYFFFGGGTSRIMKYRHVTRSTG